MRSAISIKQVNKSYGEFAAVRNLSLEVGEGSIFGLLGPNGAGKSTTIRMIVNITMPDTGEIRLFDRPMNDQLQQHIGYLPEDRGLYKRMKVGDQLRFFAELKGMEPKEAARKIDSWLERVGMTEWKDKRWDELSKGMQQKIQFVSTILHSPDLVILDEPFSGLDPINVGLLKEIVWELHKSGKTIIFSTHLMEQAEELCDEICLINRGEKILSGSIREVKRGFGWRYLAIDGEGVDEPLAQHPGVLSIEKRRDYLEISLVPGADPQAVLRDLIDAGARLTRFELVSPSLNEIFIQSIGQSGGQ
jgi:ABC-2 type transport system ATP-binding protein